MREILEKITETGRGFLDQVRKASETCYLVLLGVYIAIYFALRINWFSDLQRTVLYIRTLLLSVIMFGSAIYLFFIIIEWKKLLKNTPALIITGVVITGLTALFSYTMTLEAYNVALDLFFCVMACGKRYKNILRTVLGAALGVLVVAFLCLKLGLALEFVKPNNVSPGHSLGIIYPNTWGSIAFLAATITWYLWLKDKVVISFVFFWALTAFMYFYISCRTIALLALIFPALAALTMWLQKRQANNAINRVGAVGNIVMLTPFLCFALTLVLCWQMEWVHRTFNNTVLGTMAMRFVQGGISFRYFGFPLIGHPFVAQDTIARMIDGELVYFTVMDSAYASYAILRGMIWLIGALVWICWANRRALKRGDYALVLLSVLISVFAIMERPGLDVWYNFMLLYPLASVAGASREAGLEGAANERVMEIDQAQSDGVEPDQCVD